MPRRVPHEGEADWFLRDWCRAQGFLFDDSRFYRLSFEQQGVWWSLLLFSMKKSRIPGWFIDQGTRHPLTDAEIAYAVARSVERIDDVRAAIAELRRAGWLDFTQRDGFSIAGYEEQFCTTKERRKIAEQWRIEKKRQRTEGEDPLPLSIVRGAGER